MNKKFSTLVATLLLSGALFTVSAQKAVSPSEIDDKPGVELTENGMTLTEDVKFDDQKNYLVISQDNFVLDGAGHTLTGHIVITGNNVTVKNLTIDYCNVIPKSTGGINVSRAVHKTAITVIAESVTLDNNVINCSSDYWLANAITIFPTKEDAKIIVTNNTITGANPEANSWSSTGLQIVGDYNLANTGVSGQSGSTVKSLDKLVLTVSGNGYDKCSRDYGYSTDWSDTNKKAGTTIASQVTPLIENGKIVNGGALSSDINSAAENATITFNGTAEQLAEALEGQTINNKVAVNTNDGVVVSGVKQLDETLFGYDLVESATSNYSVLVLRSNNNSSYYAVSLDKDGVAQTTQIADVDDMKKFAEETPLWSMSTGEDSDGKVWFKFKNQEGKDLTVGGKTTFYSVADATYDNGVVFTLDGSPELKETEGTASVATNYFGLYTGSKLVSASDLNWFEKDGFSVTIKYKGPKTMRFSRLKTNLPNPEKPEADENYSGAGSFEVPIPSGDIFALMIKSGSNARFYPMNISPKELPKNKFAVMNMTRQSVAFNINGQTSIIGPGRSFIFSPKKKDDAGITCQIAKRVKGKWIPCYKNIISLPDDSRTMLLVYDPANKAVPRFNVQVLNLR